MDMKFRSSHIGEGITQKVLCRLKGNIEPQHSCLRIEKFHTSVYDAVAQTNVNGWEEHRRGDLPEPVEPE
eukprot:1162082-Pelagomonas_calceolata.AAC.1